MNRRRFLRTATYGLGGAVVAGSAATGWHAHQAGLVMPDETPFAPWDALAHLATHDPTTLAAAAILASNPHNTQPWKIGIDETAFRLHADPDRHLGAFDPYRREMWLGLGAAVANAELVAPEVGFQTDAPRLHDLATDGSGTIELALTKTAARPSPLGRMIPKRRTNRAPFAQTSVPDEVMRRVSKAVGETLGVSILTFDRTSKKGMAFAEATVEGTKAINADYEMSHDGHVWFRGTARKVAEHRDGVSIPTAGLSPTMSVLGQLLPEADTETSGKYWLASTERQVTYTGGFGVVLVDDLYNRHQQIAAGRLWQRVHLAFTAEGVAAHPLNQLPELVDRDRDLGQDRGWRNALRSIAGGARHATFAFRFGYPTREVPHSARRPVEWMTGTNPPSV